MVLSPYRFVINNLCYFEVCCLHTYTYPNVCRTFIMSSCGNLSDVFSVSVEVLMWFPLLISVVVCLMYWFLYVSSNLYIPVEVHLKILYGFLNVFLNSLCKHFVEKVCIYVQQETVLSFPFIFWVLILYMYQDNAGFLEWIW